MKMVSSRALMDSGKPLDIVIVGGSCAGLFAGILLKRQGHNIRILEAATSSEREGLAAGISLASNVQRFFEKNDLLRDVPFGTPSECVSVRDEGFEPQQTIPVSYQMTSWDAIYYRLRANFDAYKSPYCSIPPALGSSDGEAIFESGVKVLSVNEDIEKLHVVAEDSTSHAAVTYQADFVIAADGANSAIRRQLLPGLVRDEPGYMIWRGVVPTKVLPKTLLEKIENKMTIYSAKSSSRYMVIYTIPGLNGTLDDGCRFINAAWYAWPTHHSISSILTDTTGHIHRTTLPKGQMRPEVWAEEVKTVRQTMHPNVAELVEKIQEPFASVVSSVVSTKAAHYSDRLFLLGDALAQVQPNQAQGTNLAATEAIHLADVFAGRSTVQEFEKEVIETARQENAKAIAFATQFLL